MSERLVPIIKKMLNEDKKVRNEKIRVDKYQSDLYEKIFYSNTNHNEAFDIFERYWQRLSKPCIENKKDSSINLLLDKRKLARKIEKSKRKAIRKKIF